MEKASCAICRKPRAQVRCGICEDDLCTSCAIFLDESTFAMRAEVAPQLKHSYYCQACHSQQVEPAIEEYEQVLEAAKGVYIFSTERKRPVQTLRKDKQAIEVNECEDRNEVFLRLGFQAHEKGYNAVVEAEVTPVKIRNGGHHRTVWKGKGFPAEVDAEKLERHARRDEF